MPKLFNPHDANVPPSAIKVGRGSPWNTPFRLGFDGDQDMILAKHARWLAEDPRLLRALDELRGRDLVCDCAAPPCHGDLLLRLAAMSRDERLGWSRGVMRAAE